MINPQQDAYIIEVPVTLAVATELKTYACSLDEQQTLAHTLRKRTEGLPFLRFLAVGNKILLQSETIIHIKVSRSATEADFQELQSRIINRNAPNTLTIISSFVSQGERRILNLAIEARVPAVFFAQFDISDQSKIPAELLPAINEGRLLMLAPWPTIRNQAFFVRNQCLLINRIAEIISTLDKKTI